MKLFLFGLITIGFYIFDTLAFAKGGDWAVVASRLWLAWTVYYFLYVFFVLYSLLIQDLKTKKIFGISILLLVTFLASFKLEIFPINISGESTLELKDALNNMRLEDYGYTKTAFLGNINRQYFLSAIPTLLLGRNIIALRLGFLIPFLLGVYLFYAGLRIFYKKSHQSYKLSSLAILTLFSFPLLTVMLRSFDAVILPIAYTMQALGVLLITLKKPYLAHFLSLSWVLSMLSTVYTPTLSSWGLIIAIVVIYAVKKLLEKKYTLFFFFLLSSVVSLVFCWNAFKVRQDVRVGQIDSLSFQTAVEKTADAFRYFLVEKTNMYDQQVPYVGQLLFFPVILYLSGGLLFLWGIKHFFLIIWIVATLAATGISQGFAKPPIWFGIQRALIIIPFLLLSFVDLIVAKDLKISRKLEVLLSVIIITFNLIIIHSIYRTSQQVFDFRSIVIRDMFTTTQNYFIDEKTPIQLGTFTKSSNFRFFTESLPYLFPNYIMLEETKPCFSNLDPAKTGIFYTDKKECLEEIGKNSRFQKEEIIDLIIKKREPEMTKYIYLPLGR